MKIALPEVERDTALALQRALRVAVDSGELMPNTFALVIEFRKELAARLVVADVTA